MGKRKKETTDNRQELIELATRAVEKKFKDTPIGTGTEQLLYPTIWASLGSLSLDRVCRGHNPGGIPIGPKYGRIIHIAGDWSTGKSLRTRYLSFATSCLISINWVSESMDCNPSDADSFWAKKSSSSRW